MNPISTVKKVVNIKKVWFPTYMNYKKKLQIPNLQKLGSNPERLRLAPNK